MAMIVDRPPSADPPDSTPDAEGVTRSSRAPQPGRSWLDRYQQHLWIGGVSLIVLGAVLAPIVLAPTAPKLAAVNSGSASLGTGVSFTASEFKFSPNSIRVPVGHKISLTLNNSGSVEHDLTIPGRDSVCRPGPASPRQVSLRSTSQASLSSSVPFRATKMRA